MAWPVTASWVRGYPGARLANRCPYLAVALWGTDEERAAYRAATDSSHRHVRSGPDRFFTTGFLRSGSATNSTCRGGRADSVPSR